jgi:hypothetical protein
MNLSQSALQTIQEGSQPDMATFRQDAANQAKISYAPNHNEIKSCYLHDGKNSIISNLPFLTAYLNEHSTNDIRKMTTQYCSWSRNLLT